MIDTLASDFKVSKNAASRLIMSEYSYFNSLATKDSMSDIGVKEFEVLETLDGTTCSICQDMDKKHFPMSQFEIGVTAPPFHNFCRGTTIPYFNDEFTQNAKRAARDPETGKTVYIDDMSYKDWKEKFVSNDKFTSGGNSDIIKTSNEDIAVGYPPDFIYKRMSREERKRIIQKGQKTEKPIYSYDKKQNCFPTYAQKIPKEPFTFDVIAHGTDSCIDFFSENSQNNNIDAYTLACILKGREDYQEFINGCTSKGKDPVIRMLSCNTGNTDNTGDCFAQLLANELGVKVKAPNDMLYAFPDGSNYVGRYRQGKWIEFFSRR